MATGVAASTEVLESDLKKKLALEMTIAQILSDTDLLTFEDEAKKIPFKEFRAMLDGGGDKKGNGTEEERGRRRQPATG